MWLTLVSSSSKGQADNLLAQGRQVNKVTLSRQDIPGTRDYLPGTSQRPFLSLECVEFEHPKSAELTLDRVPLNFRSGILVKLLPCLKAERKVRKPQSFNT